MLDGFEEIARNLLSLEVNTLISDGMTAEKMPNGGEALIQVAQVYQDFLSRCVRELRGLGQDVPGLPAVESGGSTGDFTEWAVHTGGTRTFALLREAARACQAGRGLAPLPHALQPAHDTILLRIVASCDQVRAMFLSLRQGEVAVNEATVTLAEEASTPSPPFSRDALVSLRKIWELGTSTVVMQTVVQIDGDVMCRVLDGWDSPACQTLHEIHRQAVDVSLQRWSFLVQTARDLLSFFLSPGQRPDSVPGVEGPPDRRRLGGPS